MLRPNIIRADTIDLQDRSTPSAQDHSQQPTHPAAIGTGPPAPHQAEALRESAAETAQENYYTPNTSSGWANGNRQQQDALAVAQNGGQTGSSAEDAEMADAEGDDSLDEDDMMDKISSSPSIDDEDIDFEFVYALHTFVATVEGQANATKGDTMVLLDDSNSYWWLVRVVKDSSIGYLPAEHIETPTERLARLNKHRNIDLSATMLGDQADKPTNPLKKAIRRRNAKTVTFNQTHIYVEASDVEYSSDEDGEDNFLGHREDNAEAEKAHADEDEIVSAEPERAAVREVKTGITDDSKQAASDHTPDSSTEIIRTSDEIFDGRQEGASKSRNGTVRNTDSFFKDDTVETRKITITPNLLRDDSSTSTRTSNDSNLLRQRPSLDKMEKDSVNEKSKDKKAGKEKKDKEKKPGMLSGLFKRKDKKSKAVEEDIDELILGKKTSSERTTSPTPSKNSEDNIQAEDSMARGRNGSPQRQPSKLQRQRPDASVAQSTKTADEGKPLDSQSVQAPDRLSPGSLAQEASMRLVQPDGEQASQTPQPLQTRSRSPSVTRNASASQESVHDSKSSGGTLSKILRSRSNSESKPEKLKKAKERLDLDDSDTPVETVESVKDQANKPSQGPIPGAFPDTYGSANKPTETQYRHERLSESPVHVSPVDTSRSNPPALVRDTSSQDEASSPMSSPSPELVEVEEINGSKGSEISATPTSTSTWSDAHLRTFFDDDTDIKDLLVVVFDKSGVEPAGPDHPITGNLFKAENAKLADITSRLDNMLGDWLARKRTTSSR